MPELPEIEHLRRSLEGRLLGARILRVALRRRDVLRADRRASATELLLEGGRIDELRRHGKHLAIITEDRRVLCVHLGMSGRLLLSDAGRWPGSSHVHCIWTLDQPPAGRPGEATLVFADPRRFGGLWAFASPERLLADRWDVLGPDALTCTRKLLVDAFGRTKRSVKTTLLDQHVIAGVGNIYADEALHRAGINPVTPANILDASEVRRLLKHVQIVLRDAVKAGGSTIRDYRRADGTPGAFAGSHRVYGRSGQPCLTCGTILEGVRLAQRATVFCPACQPASSGCS